MADQSRIAQKFKALYIHGLTDVENGKPKPRKKRDDDYAELSHFINDLRRAKDVASLDTCISEYLKIYRSYTPADPRSKMAITHLLTSRIELSSPEDKFLTLLSHELSDSAQPFTPRRSRFESLDHNQQQEIRGWLKDKESIKEEKKRQSNSLLDLLREEYARQNRLPAKDYNDLYDFDPANSDSLKASLKEQLQKVTNLSAACAAENIPQNRKAFHKCLDDYRDYVRGTLKDNPFQTFQLIKYLRDQMKTQRVNKGTWVQTIPGDHSELMCELYTITCLQLLVWASGTKLLKQNRFGFTKEEQAYFLKHLREIPYLYISNLDNRFASPLKNVPALFDGSKAFLDLIILTKTQLEGTTLVDLKKTLEIQNIWRDIDGLTKRLKDEDEAGQKTLLADPKNLEILTTFDEIIETEVPIGQRGPELGKGFAHAGGVPGVHEMFGEITIVYMNPRNPNDIYVEYSELKPSLFLVDPLYITNKLYGSRITGIARSLEGMVYVTKFMFEAMGFMPVLVEAGFAGLLQEVLISYVSGMAAEQAGKINPTLGQIVGLATMILAPRRNFKPKVVEPVDTRAIDSKGIDIIETKSGTATEAKATTQFDKSWLDRTTAEIEAKQGVAESARALEEPAPPLQPEQPQTPHVPADTPVTTSKPGEPSPPPKLWQQQQMQQQQSKVAKPGADEPVTKQREPSPPPQRRQQQGTQPTGVRVKPASETAKPKEVSGSSVDNPAAKGTNEPGTQSRAQGRSMRNTADSGVQGNNGVIAPGTRPWAGERGQNYRTTGDIIRLERSKLGYHVYEYLDENGRVLYVGKSGSMTEERAVTEPPDIGTPEPEFANWEQRLNDDHIRTTWINQAKYLRVTYDLSEPEMWALEEEVIDANQASAANWNYKQGDFSSRLGKYGMDLHANARAARNQPSVTVTIDASSGAYY